MYRICRKCRQLKAIAEFSSGRVCDLCRQSSKAERAAYLAEWRKRNGAQSSERWRADHPEYDRSYYDLNRERNIAMVLVARAVRLGVLPKACTQCCFVCGGQAYKYWHESLAPADRLKVKPVCKMCGKGLKSS